jgi:hypothetical protein
VVSREAAAVPGNLIEMQVQPSLSFRGRLVPEIKKIPNSMADQVPYVKY